VPSFFDRPLEGADRLFFGDPRRASRRRRDIGAVGFEQPFSDTLTLRNRTQYADYDKAYQNIYPGDSTRRRASSPSSPIATRLSGRT
jgi:catecholate siderophore receptor